MLMFAAMLALGAFAAQRGIIKRDSVNDVIAVSLKILLPLMLFSLVYEGSTTRSIFEHAVLIPLAAIMYAVLIAVTSMLSGLLHLRCARSAAWRMVFTFGNTGFIGLPVLVALFPDSGSVMLALFMTVDQAIFWTYGLRTAKGATGGHALLQFMHAFANPNIIAVFGAIALVLAGVSVPTGIASFLSTMGAAATPVCMLCLGAMFQFADVRGLLRFREVAVGVGVKMLVVPLATGLCLGAMPLPYDVSVALTMLAAMPATTLVPLTLQAHGGDSEYATVLSVVTIIASVVTMPLVAGLLWG